MPKKSEILPRGTIKFPWSKNNSFVLKPTKMVFFGALLAYGYALAVPILDVQYKIEYYISQRPEFNNSFLPAMYAWDIVLTLQILLCLPLAYGTFWSTKLTQKSILSSLGALALALFVTGTVIVVFIFASLFFVFLWHWNF
jgi:hypothetical protein